MSKHRIFAAVVILITFAMSAFIAWCSGYNFDERNPWVALWVGTTFMFCFPILGIMGLIQ